MASYSSKFIYIILYLSMGLQWNQVHYYSGHYWPSVRADGDGCGAISGMNEWQEKSKYSMRTCPSAALCTTDRTRLDPGSNPDHRGGVSILSSKYFPQSSRSDPLSLKFAFFIKRHV
jgi:hypothetical protein